MKCKCAINIYFELYFKYIKSLVSYSTAKRIQVLKKVILKAFRKCHLLHYFVKGNEIIEAILGCMRIYTIYISEAQNLSTKIMKISQNSFFKNAII